jgi:hypothetical protein
MTVLERDASLELSWADSATITLVSSDIAGHSKWTQWKTWKHSKHTVICKYCGIKLNVRAFSKTTIIYKVCILFRVNIYYDQTFSVSATLVLFYFICLALLILTT